MPALVYAALGSSRELAVGSTAVISLLFASTLGTAASPAQDPALYASLAFTATFFAGAFQAALGVLRLGFLIDFLSHAAIVGFMGGAATIVALQQFRGFLGLPHFTHDTDLPAVMRSVFSQSAYWHWQPFLLGACIFVFLQITRYIVSILSIASTYDNSFLFLLQLLIINESSFWQSRRRPKLLWISAAAPLASIVASTLLIYLINGEKYSIETVSITLHGQK